MDSASDFEKKPVQEHREYADSPIESSSLEDEEYIKKEKKVVRKLDTFIAPVMMLLMLISYLDRGNIGFAATQGMTVDIGLGPQQLNVGATQYINRVRSNAYCHRSPSRSFTSSTFLPK